MPRARESWLLAWYVGPGSFHNVTIAIDRERIPIVAHRLEPVRVRKDVFDELRNLEPGCWRDRPPVFKADKPGRGPLQRVPRWDVEEPPADIPHEPAGPLQRVAEPAQEPPFTPVEELHGPRQLIGLPRLPPAPDLLEDLKGPRQIVAPPPVLHPRSGPEPEPLGPLQHVQLPPPEPDELGNEELSPMGQVQYIGAQNPHSEEVTVGGYQNFIINAIPAEVLTLPDAVCSYLVGVEPNWWEPVNGWSPPPANPSTGSVVKVYAAYSQQYQNLLIIGDPTSTSSFAIALLDAVAYGGQQTTFKHPGTAHTVTLTPVAGQTIDGQSTYVLAAGQAVTLVSDGGTNWRVTYSTAGGGIAQSTLGQPGGPAQLGSDGYVGGATGSPLTPSVALGTNAAGGATTATNSRASTIATPVLRDFVSLTDYGAVGDYNGSTGTDNSTELASAISNLPTAGGTIYVSQGNFLVNTSPTMKAQVRFKGMGKGSTITFGGNGVSGTPARLFDVNTYQGVQFESVQLALTSTAQYASLVRYHGAFHGSLVNCWLTGQNGGSSAQPNQIGLELDANAGDNRVVACDISQLGYGIYTSSQQNYVFGGSITNCVVGVYGWNDSAGGWASNSGMSLMGTTIVATGTIGLASAATNGLLIAGPGMSWWLTNVWIEGVPIGCQVGDGTGGPSQFYWKGGRSQATSTCLAIVQCHTTTLEDIRLSEQSPGTAATVTYITVNPTNCVNGTAKNVYINSATTGNTTIPLYAVGTCTTSSSSTPTNLTSVATTSGTLALGQIVTTPNTPAGASITAISGTTVTLSSGATVSGSGVAMTVLTYPPGWSVDGQNLGQTLAAGTLLALTKDATGPGGGGTGVDWSASMLGANGSTTGSSQSWRINGGRARFGWDGTVSGGRAYIQVNGGTTGEITLRCGVSTNASDMLRVSNDGTTKKFGVFGNLAAQPTAGAATAAASYSTNEQLMLQTVYNALRTLGLMS